MQTTSDVPAACSGNFPTCQPTFLPSFVLSFAFLKSPKEAAITLCSPARSLSQPTHFDPEMEEVATGVISRQSSERGMRNKGVIKDKTKTLLEPRPLNELKSLKERKAGRKEERKDTAASCNKGRQP